MRRRHLSKLRYSTVVQPAQSAPPGRKRRTEEAIRLAMAGDWKAAAAANEALLKDFDDDVEAANRLGKAYTELGKAKKAVKAYERTLEIDQYNSIARKNLDRLQQADASKPKVKAKTAAKGKAKSAAPRGAAAVLVSSAKAAEFQLQQANPAEVSQLEPGDTAELRSNNRGVAVTTEDGTVLGYIEPAAGLRLRRLIEGGNEYDVTIRSIDEHGGAIVFIRETHRDASLAKEASFLASAETRKKAPRAYTRRSALIEEDEPEITDHDTEDDETPLAELQDLAEAEDDETVDALGIEDDEEVPEEEETDEDEDPDGDGDPEDDEDR
jgi:tetratricopeptide (TPR) repeat protein